MDSNNSNRKTPRRLAQAGMLTGLLLILINGCQHLGPDEPEALSQEAVRTLLSSLPALDPEPEHKAFKQRPGSTPPPQSGQTRESSFPPHASSQPAPTDTPQPPELVRYAPEGDINQAALLTLNFSEPMVPLGAHGELLEQAPPVRIAPEVEGRWRWVDPHNLTFEPKAGRFPMATEFQVNLERTMTSAADLTLTQGASWGFSTPTLALEQVRPRSNEPVSRQPVLILAFNQAFDAEAVLPYIALEVNNEPRAVQIASDEAITNDNNGAADTVEALNTEHWLAITPAEPLPRAATATLRLKPGAPALEGQRLSREAQTHNVKVAGPLAISQTRCHWGDNPCRPDATWNITLTNPLTEDWSQDQIRIEPARPGAQVHQRGNNISIAGTSEPQTQYQVWLKAGTEDRFGQVLDEDVKVAFEVENHAPYLMTDHAPVIIMPGGQPAELPVTSRNIDRFEVELRRVEPKDWDSFSEYLQQRWRSPSDADATEKPGTLIERYTQTVSGERNTLVQTQVPLGSALNEDQLGHAVVFISAPALEAKAHSGRASPLTQPHWVQVTNLGLSAHKDREQTLVWATALANGLPLEDVAIEYAQATGTTDSKGLALLDQSETENSDLLIARKGTDSAFLNPDSSRHYWSDHPYDDYRHPVFMFDDRGIYRPGESAHLKGIIRARTPGPEGDIQWPQTLSQVDWVLTDSRRNELATGTEAIGGAGSFDIEFELPATAALGRAQLHYTLVSDGAEAENSGRYHTLQIQEFRRPEYEVSSRFSAGTDNGQEPYLAGDELSATLAAAYYAGGALPQAEVDWNLSLRSNHYAPPGHEGFIFGAWKPYWRFPGIRNEETWSQSFTGTTDSAGEHRLDIAANADFSSLVYPHRLSADASVTDVNRQSWGSSNELLVHPAEFYIGVRPHSLFVEQGEAINLDIILVDTQGGELSTRAQGDLSASVIAEHMEWNDDAWEPSDQQQCPRPKDDTLSQCEFAAEHSGKYRITAQVNDAEGRTSQTQMDIWVSGGHPIRPLNEAGAAQEITLIPDQQTYAPGDTAYVQIDTPFSPAEALVTLRRQGIVSYEPLHLEDGSHQLAIDITDKMLPTLVVDVGAVGQAGEPVHAHGRLALPISTESRQLNVDLALSADQLKPGEGAAVTIDVTSHTGEPVDGGELTLYAVDESVLALTSYELPNPLSSFYASVNEGVASYNARDKLRQAGTDSADVMREEVMVTGAMAMSSPAARAKSKSESATGTLRSNFSALATFEAAVALNSDGQARVEFDLPDNLTRYRIMAVAHREQQFGSAQTELEVGLPLMVRPSLPRFLNLGDSVELPVVVQNSTNQPMTVELALRARNLELTEAAGRKITVPAKDRREVRFTAQPRSAGTADVQVIAQSNQSRDSAQLSLPVLTPATTEAFAQYGSLTEGTVFQPVTVPSSVYGDFGGLSISTSSTQFQSLTDAFIYLLEYPHSGSEQTASRLMSIAALSPMLEAFGIERLPAEEDIQEQVSNDLERLAERQNRDGGWGFWRLGESSQAYLSVHITQALLRARDAGYAVPDDMLAPARNYLANLENHLASPESDASEVVSSRLHQSIRAYGLYVQKVAGNPQPNAALALLEKADKDELSIEALGWLLMVLSEATGYEETQQDLHRRLNNSVRESAATAQFLDDYPRGGHQILHGARRTDAVVLEALLHTQPEHSLIDKIARGLLNQRYQGHWGNTQENVFVLQALKAYFDQREGEEPELTARAWLGELFLGEHQYQGRTTEQNAINVPMQQLLNGPPNPQLALQQEGTGRLYYRLGLRYAPDDLLLDAAAHGINVTREYEAVNDPSDVTQHRNGHWEIRAGAAVRVKLTMTVPARRHYLALSDFLPAGLEALNPDLEVTTRSAAAERNLGGTGATRYWQRHWYDHQQQRDERIDAFAQQLQPGTYHYEYLALATTPGDFIAPPAKAEEMYQPETFGRSETMRVRVVEER